MTNKFLIVLLMVCMVLSGCEDNFSSTKKNVGNSAGTNNSETERTKLESKNASKKTTYVDYVCNQLFSNGGKPMNNYAKSILATDDANDLILQILEIIQEKCDHGNTINRLSDGEKLIYLIGEVEGEVNNGGFSQYLFNSSGKHAKEAVQALKEIKAGYTAALLEEAVKIYKNGPTRDNINEFEKNLSDKQEKQLNDLDNKFYQYTDNLYDLQLQYINNHIEEF